MSPSQPPKVEKARTTAHAATSAAATGLAFRERARFWRDALLRRMLAFADSIAVIAANALLVLFDAGVDAAFWSSILLPVWILAAKVHGLYDRDHRALRHLTVDELPGIAAWALVGTATVSLLLQLTPAGLPTLHEALVAWVAVATTAFVLRVAARALWRAITPREATLVIGDGPLARAARRKFELFPDIHVRVVAQRSTLNSAELETERTFDEIDRIILASQAIDERLISDLVALCRRRRIKLSVVPPARGMFGTAVQLNHIADLPVVQYNTWDASRSTLLLKRILDLIGSLTALVVFALLFALIVLVILLETGRPVFFSQVRAGRGGRPYRMHKFRTMIPNAEELLPQLVALDDLDEPVFKLANDPRVTRVGRLLRRTSLDELPQLLNVLRGDMSLVGPRPEQADLVARYTPEQQVVRLSVQPGMTGPMQIYGRGHLTFEERLAVEREYVENLSFVRDLRILALTLPTVVSGKGAF